MSTVLQTLGELCISQPKSKIKAGEGLKEGKYKFFTSSNIQDKFYNDYQYDKPALIFGTGGNASIHYCDEPFSTSTDCIVFYAKDKTVSLKAIYRFIEGNMHILEEGFHGAGLKHISKEYLLNIKISPNLFDVQNNVVNVFDKLSTLIEKRNQQLEKLDLLIKSKFIEMFGHQDKNEKNFIYGNINDVATIYLGLTYTPNYLDSGVKFISAKNTSKDFLDLSEVKFISRDEFVRAPLGAKPRKGDVLFSRIGSNLGHPVILEIDEELCTFVSLGFLRTKGAVTNLYLKHWMRDSYFAEQVRQKVVGGGQPNLNTGWLKEFKIIIPPIELQNEFSKFVEKTEKIKITIKQSLNQLQTLKKALMQKYFGGGNEITDYM